MLWILKAGNYLEILKHGLKVDGMRLILRAWFFEILNDIECYVIESWYSIPTT